MSNDIATDGSGLAFDYDDDLNGVIETLQEGDQIVTDNRTLPMEVFDTDCERIGSNIHPTTTAYLELRGRVYRLRGESHYPGYDDTTPPMLELRQEGRWKVVRSCVSSIRIVDGQQIMSDIRAGEWLAEAGIDVR